MKQDYITDPATIKKIIREYYEQLSTYNFNN